MHADAQLQLMLSAAGGVFLRHALLQVDQAAHRGVGRGEGAEGAVTRGVDDAALQRPETLAQQVEVQLLQLAPGGITESREIGRRADDVGEHQQHLPLETARQLLLQLVLQADDLRHREGAEVHRGLRLNR